MSADGFDFGGRVALVTGGGRGIGRATASLLANLGCAVVVNDVNEDSAASAQAEISAAGGSAAAIAADVSSAADVGRLVDETLGQFSKIDFLVNNAGISLYRPIVDCSEDDWDAHVDIMAKGTFLMIRAVAPGMVARRFGRIVNLGSYVAQLNCTTKYLALTVRPSSPSWA